MDTSQVESQSKDTRTQPWKKFVKVPEQPTTVEFQQHGDDSIRLIQGRVDGKDLGG